MKIHIRLISVALLGTALFLSGCRDQETPDAGESDTVPAQTVAATQADTVISTLSESTPATVPSETPPTTDTVTIPTTEPSTESETDTEPTTESVTEPETVPVWAYDAIDPIARTLTVEGGEVVLTLTLEPGTPAGIPLTLILSDGDGIIANTVLDTAVATHTVRLACPADRIAGKLTVTAGAPSHTSDTAIMTLRMKNGLPQLTTDGIRCVIAAMTDEEKAHMVTGTRTPVKMGASGGTYAITRFGIPSVTVNDGPAGVRYNQSVWYPSVINVSSSWDPTLATTIGQSIGEDALALGMDVVLAPGMNIQKNVLGGRNFEYSSEDPILTALMVAPYVQGVQSTGVGTSIKHFAVNNQETARGSVSANVTERALREIYLKAFGMVVTNADPFTVMSSYNKLNGIHTAANTELLTGILREEFGYTGMVMSDWGAQGTMAEKINAMNDLNMPGNENDPADVLTALKAGVITETSLDACVYNVLRLVTRSATFRGLSMNTRVDQVNHHTVATQAAADTMILLQNNSTLPLATGTKIAVFGNGSMQTVFGGAGSGSVNAVRTISIFNGLCRADGLTVVNRENNPFLNCPAHSATDAGADIEVTEAYAAEMAAAADVAIVVISRNSTEGSDRSSLPGDFRLNATESAMIERLTKAFHAVGGRVVVLLNTGSPIEVVSWKDSVDAILWTGYAGQGTGTAVACVLTGEVNPSAKTTITWPTTYKSTPAATHFPGSANDVTYYEDIYVGYRYYSTFDVDVAYPFGYGLSYTTFAYSHFSISKNDDGTLTATVTVKNTGTYAGREIVQFYVSKPEDTREQAAIELCGFAKTTLLEPGASETVTAIITVDALKSYDTATSRWMLDEGNYRFSVGASSADLSVSDTASIRFAETVVQDVENRCVPDTTFDYIQKEIYTVPPAADDSRVNLALGRPATANYNENDSYLPSMAVDGDYITRWSGLGLPAGQIHTWEVDLGEVYALGSLSILWESIHAPFTIYTSTDGETYTAYQTYLDDGSARLSTNLYGHKARYLRVCISMCNQAISIFEFEVYEATEADIEAGKNRPSESERVNLALDKTVTAATVQDSFVAANAVDGDITTRWGSQPSGEGWITVDLGEVTHITEIELLLEAAWVPYYVEYSLDGEHFFVVASGQKDQLALSKSNLDLETRYIRIRRDGENWFSIYEISVYNTAT